MTGTTAIVRWQSTLDPLRCGVEIAGFASNRHRLATELDNGLGKSSVERPAFVFTALGSARADEIAVAISQASDFSFGARMCVAMDQKTLSATDPIDLRNSNVGIVLDQVDADTPLSAISTDLVEAVRFDESFVRRAMVDSRSACVLAAMLGLAHDLGLATLGSVGNGLGTSEFEFDYVIEPISE